MDSDRLRKMEEIFEQAKVDERRRFEDVQNERKLLSDKVNDLEKSLRESIGLKDKISKLEEELKVSAEKANEMDELETELETLKSMPYGSESAHDLEVKNERIEELEEALRESVRITADREVLILQYENIMREMETKVGKLQAELRSLKNVQNARCTSCPELKNQLRKIENKLNFLLSERQTHLTEMFDVKHEALSAAMSEKDAHIAWLEMSGIKDMKTSDGVDRLRDEKRKLMLEIKKQNEQRVTLLSEYNPVSPSCSNTMYEEVRERNSKSPGSTSNSSIPYVDE
ncbi:ERC1 (predicted) [Pycnogonum litorale]